MAKFTIHTQDKVYRAYEVEAVDIQQAIDRLLEGDTEHVRHIDDLEETLDSEVIGTDKQKED